MGYSCLNFNLKYHTLQISAYSQRSLWLSLIPTTRWRCDRSAYRFLTITRTLTTPQCGGVRAADRTRPSPSTLSIRPRPSRSHSRRNRISLRASTRIQTLTLTLPQKGTFNNCLSKVDVAWKCQHQQLQ